MNRYLSAIIILAALTSNTELQAQSLKPAPRLVVNIIIDQLRTDYISRHFTLRTGSRNCSTKAVYMRLRDIHSRRLTVHRPSHP